MYAIRSYYALKAATIAAGKGIGPGVLFYDDKMGVEVHEFLDSYRSCDILDVQDSRITSYNVCYTKLLRIWHTAFQSTEFKVGFIVFVVLVLAAIFYPMLSGIDPIKMSIREKMLPPLFMGEA